MSWGRFVTYTAVFLDLGCLGASVGLLLLLFVPLPRLIEVITEVGSYSSSFRFLFFFSRASMGAAGVCKRRYARELHEDRRDMKIHLLIHTRDGVCSLLGFQQVFRKLNKRSHQNSPFLATHTEDRLWIRGKCTD